MCSACSARGIFLSLSTQRTFFFLASYVRRSYAAHQNSWEAMILWTAAVMVAKAMDVDEDKMNCSAAVWMCARAV